MRLNTSVVIATRDRCAELLRTLGELSDLDPTPPIIVVDNDSRDATADAVAEEFPDVALVRAPRNLGAAARNIGVQRAATPYVAFSDDDSWWRQGSLARAEEVFSAHPGVGVIAARTLVGEQERRDPVNDLMARSPLRSPAQLPGPRILGFTACAAIVRRDAFLSVGGFSRELFFAAEEKLLACDVAAAGWDLIYVDDIVAHHHPSTARDDHGRRVLELRNDVLISWMRQAPAAAVTRTARLLQRALVDPPSRRAALAVLRRLPTALTHRRQLPAEVRKEMDVLEVHPW
ncbi:glycosyl transferase [Saccharopolyspora subtropica]|uniref:Glycosyl transferase n=1 Tax=Saccharopolyspora thermophila TaxID=89367 RepID=A0A917JYS5_9PSEU|nr:glycosyltransferase [Saccharopolyspora subtropica]GGI89398.1 glycosyl transferase [Saccharopolyspora subtropica]